MINNRKNDVCEGCGEVDNFVAYFPETAGALRDENELDVVDLREILK